MAGYQRWVVGGESVGSKEEKKKCAHWLQVCAARRQVLLRTKRGTTRRFVRRGVSIVIRDQRERAAIRARTWLLSEQVARVVVLFVIVSLALVQVGTRFRLPASRSWSKSGSRLRKNEIGCTPRRVVSRNEFCWPPLLIGRFFYARPKVRKWSRAVGIFLNR